MYLKKVGNQIIFLVLYVDDILLASSNLKLLKDTKSFPSKHFDMKDLGEASYVLELRSKGIGHENFWVCHSRVIFLKF